MLSHMLLLAGLLAACEGGEQAVLDPFPTALAAYDAGVAALEAGDGAGAVVALQQAVAADPGSAELQLWLGRAQAAAGDPQAAVASAGGALDRRPGWGPALYNRACWRAHLGDLAGAAADLEAALATDAVGVLHAAADPDLDPLRADPAFAGRVPARGLPVLAEGRSESVFLGSDWTLTVFLRHRADTPFSLDWDGPVPPGLSLKRVVEDITYEGDEVRRSVSWTWRVGGPFEGTVGPLLVRSGVLEGRSEPLTVRFLAPPDTPVAADSAPALPISSELFGPLETGRPVRHGDQVRVRIAAGDRIAWSELPRPLVRHELREDGQALWVGHEGTTPPSTVVTVRRGRRALFEGPVP